MGRPRPSGGGDRHRARGGLSERPVQPLEECLLQCAAGGNQAVFTYQIGYFCVLAAFWIGLKVYQLYLNQWLQFRWRRWMTERYLGGWLHDANHYRMQLLGDAADNPDQRIAEDTQRFVEQTLQLGIGLLSAVVTLVSLFSFYGACPTKRRCTCSARNRNPRLPGMGRIDLCGARHHADPSDRLAAGRAQLPATAL